jgi:opacity protein-like surface antigen
MKNMLIIASSLAVFATPVLADVAVNTENTNGQNQQTSATNYNTFEGSTAIDNTPSMGSGNGNSTAPCVVASGFGISGPGAGVSHSRGRINEDCITRVEAVILYDIATMPTGVEKTAVITHFCNNDESMRNTLQSIGLCPTAVRPALVQQTTQTYVAPYTFCGYNLDGIFTVRVNAQSPDDAAQQCTQDFIANGHVNIGSL